MAAHQNALLDPPPLAARAEIDGLLGDILRSAPFRTSRQCQDLFRYIVRHSLTGSDDSLRERVIGMEVFGRAPDYDTAEDPVVRLRAADVRKRLAQYYQAQKSEAGHWKIEIPTGSYRAQFHPPETPLPQIAPLATPIIPKAQAAPSLPTGTPVQSKASHSRRHLWLTGALAFASILAIFAGLRFKQHTSAAPTALDLFWGPVLESSRPVLICTGSNSVYILPLETRARYRKSHPLAKDATPNLEGSVPKEDLRRFRGDDFVPVQDTYLTVGDASATTQISSLFTSRHHAYDLRFGNDLSFGDLREGSAVLIGAFNNSWTLHMTDSLRFVFDSGDSPDMHVRDRFDAARSWWPKQSGQKFSEDYAIISRILNSKTGSVLVTIAGLDHTGTRAAGDFATNPQLLADLVKQAPKDWSRKNLQVVLHTNVVNDIPASPTVVAAYYW